MENKVKNPNTTVNFFKEKKDMGRVKHAIVKMYFDAWFPIMAQSEFTMSDKIVMIDGFCGTGFYDKTKEDGSPIVALKAVLNHNLKSNFKRKIELVFIDYDPANTEKLEARIELVKAEFPDWQDYVIIRVITATFVSAIDSITEDSGYDNVPILLFADPFGYSGDIMPMTSINKILSRKKCEALINVHDGSANRFFRVESHQDTITKFVGSSDWLQVRKKGLSPAEKLTIFINTYCKNLESEHTLRFAMREPSNRHKYDLIFATDHMQGIKAMKKAMADYTHDMETLFFSASLSYRPVKITISKEYKDYCAKETFQLILSLYSGEEVFGSRLEVFILKETPYHFNFRTELKSLLRSYICQPVGSKKFNALKFSIPNLCEDRAISARMGKNNTEHENKAKSTATSIQRTANGIKKKYTKTSTAQSASNGIKRKYTKKATTKEPSIEAKKRKYIKKKNSKEHCIGQNDTQSQTLQSTTTSTPQKRTREKSPQAGPSSTLIQENIEPQLNNAKSDSENDVKTNTDKPKLDEVASVQSEKQSPSNSANTQTPRNSRSRSKKPSKSITSAKDQPKITTFFTKFPKPE